ncbi:DUF4192 domain-containing protein [Rhizohabitans arisaemae]|uniref:DUF4192 domain-containing protein n=1 Tax=Rhizohabitans arisaemae TaxID=2720610 RepID=UPI0024B259B1|nr:DUF4192 domain-containing protein [Rhizohabitans arisaemae]
MRLSSQIDVLAAIPYLIGFYPENSLVIVAIAGDPSGGELQLTARGDLPLPGDWWEPVLRVLEREKITQVMLVGYGPGPSVTPVVEDALARIPVPVVEALRVESDRYWSYLCANPSCCSPEGMPFDPAASAVPAEATLAGMVAMPDRAALERSIAPFGGLTRLSMRQATDRAVAAVRERLGGRPSPRRTTEFVDEGLARLRAAVDLYRDGGRLDHDTAARLGLDLLVVRIRDDAWVRIDDGSRKAHTALWTDLTRRLEEPFLAAPTSLLAVTVWGEGACTLAGIAVDRALTADPTYSMAHLLLHGLRNFVTPRLIRTGFGGPEHLAAEMGPPSPHWLAPLLIRLVDYRADDRRPAV